MNKNPTQITSWSKELNQLKANALFRAMPCIDGPPGRKISVNGRKVLNFSSNNYLGLAGHPKLIKAVEDYTRLYGAGSTASRLIAGNTEAHRELESALAIWKGAESALVFGSGYQANIGILSSIPDETDLIISDELNHASIIDGCRLSKANLRIYPHLDMDHLEDLLRVGSFRRKLVVTESVFSMDGDLAPLKEISDLCAHWGATLIVDEAHASGIYGPQGQGLAAEIGVFPDIQMGTMSKAMGTYGAYVTGTKELINLLINKARSLVYSTAPPPGTMGAALAALKIISSEEGSARRQLLRKNVDNFQNMLNLRLSGSHGANHIVPILIGDSESTMRASDACLKEGIFAQGIRFPSVPEGTARLRFTLMSDHLEEDLEKAVSVLENVIRNAHQAKRALPR